MPDFLSKEEIRKWRSSLERITLEEYAQRLGKVISEEKETNDMVDIALKHNSFTTIQDETPANPYQVKAERISSLAQQSFERERELDDIRISAREPVQAKKSEIQKPEHTEKASKPAKTEKAKKAPAPKQPAPKKAEKQVFAATEDIQLTFKKNLTPREQAVFEHFLNNKNHIVYAKELAQVLELPRDYVYKYIKNLRAKLNEDAIHNADNGGFVLKV